MVENSHLSKKNGSRTRGLLSIVEKAWEIKWATRLIIIGLFLDTALLSSGRHGLIGWARGEQSELTIGWVILIGIAFCLLVAFIFPVMFQFLKILVLHIPSLPARENRKSRKSVHQRNLLDHALEEQSQFLLDFHDTEYDRHKRKVEEIDVLSDLLASLIILCGYNAYIGLSELSSPSIISALWNMDNDWVRVAIGIFILFSVAFVFQVWRSYYPCYIHYPPLAREEAKKEDKKRK